MKRCAYLRTAGVGAAALVAGCSAEPAGEAGSTDTPTGTTTGTIEGTPTLRVGTYTSFIDAPSTSPGAWVKEQFEAEHDATLEWFAPDGGIDYFLQRRNQGVTVDTDLYAGLTPENMVRADDNLQNGDSLFDSVDTGSIDNADLPEKFDELTPEPETVVSFDYGRLSGNVDDWLGEWSRQVAEQ